MRVYVYVGSVCMSVCRGVSVCMVDGEGSSGRDLPYHTVAPMEGVLYFSSTCRGSKRTNQPPTIILCLDCGNTGPRVHSILTQLTKDGLVATLPACKCSRCACPHAACALCLPFARLRACACACRDFKEARQRRLIHRMPHRTTASWRYHGGLNL